jgi:hypothetical protein
VLGENGLTDAANDELAPANATIATATIANQRCCLYFIITLL